MLLLNGLDSKSGSRIGVWLSLLYDSALGKGEAEADESLLSSSESLEDKETGRANRAHFVHCLIPLNPKVLKTKRLEQYFQFQKESNRFDVRLTMFVVLFK